MKKILVIVGAVLCSLVFVFAEARSIGSSVPGFSPSSEAASGPGAKDDHDDKGPIQVGYAIITPVVNTSGAAKMAVFATFGLREGLTGATQAGVLPSGLTTDAVLFVDTDGALQKNLGVAIVNPNGGPGPENVTLTLRGSDGNLLPNANPLVVPVPSHQQVSKFVTELFANQQSVPKSFTGTLTVTSTNPVSVIGLRFRGANFSTLPITNVVPNSGPITSYPPGIGGTNSVLLPQFAAGGGWATEIVIVNNDTADITVRADLFKQDGTALSAALNGQPPASSFTNIVVPHGGVYVLAPRDNNGKDDF
jgi:hypothetical protein